MPDRKRALVVDDDEPIRTMLAKVVERQDFEVDTARDGAEAIEMLQQDGYSVVLLDLMMPRVDGFGVIQYLKEHPPLRKPIVLIVSAYTDQKFKEVDPKVVAGVLRKPFEVSELGNLIRMCVSGYENATRQLGASASLISPADWTN